MQRIDRRINIASALKRPLVTSECLNCSTFNAYRSVVVGVNFKINVAELFWVVVNLSSCAYPVHKHIVVASLMLI